MSKYITKRLLTMLPVLLLVSVFAFGIVSLAPGDAADLFISPDATADQIEMTRERLGLNQPLIVQYGNWLLNVLTGNFGFSFSTRTSVIGLLGARIVPTLQLMGATLLVAYIIAIPLGIYCAKHKNSWIDHMVTTASFAGVSVPNFFLGLGMIYIFSLQLGWLPTGGRETLGGQDSFLMSMSYYFLPVLVLATGYSANMTRYVRATMIQVNEENFMRTAISKGLSEGKVTLRHGLRNSLIPIITVIGSDIPRLIGGAIVTEQVFRWPGIGQLMMSSIAARDYPVIMAINLLSAVAVLSSNLIVDIIYAYVDPRIRY
ncbi:ABC transporter permease [Aerococcaceae bacterium DSM 111176]|nr:ABC transporter permease [Aerococcaceae bacterium DSM 111176]MDO5649667.1 ABC transporter permease [Gallicola sp.]